MPSSCHMSADPSHSRPSPSLSVMACAACLCTLLCGGSIEASPAEPAQARVTPLLDNETIHDYSIAEGALGTSLGLFAEQSGLLLSFDPQWVRGHMAPALNGRYTARDGLQRLLENVELHVVAGSPGTYMLLPQGRAPSDVTTLPPAIIRGSELDSYSEPRSSVHLSPADIERFGQVSTGDLLKGVPGVQVGDSRNGGGLDVNIRGVQGQSRVAVRVDGSEQALDVYRGYAGTQQRSYIDPDLISSVSIHKGPTVRSGAIGGTVDIQTIGVKDILKDDHDVGLRLTGSIWNNGVKAAHRSRSAPSMDIEDMEDLEEDHFLLTTPRRKRGKLHTSQAKAGSAAFAYTNDDLDLVAGYAQRGQGNYFSGRKGQNRYRTRDERADEMRGVTTIYKAGDEVLNSSNQTESYLLKTTLRLTDEQSLHLGYRRYDGQAGEIMPSDIFRDGTAGIYQYPLNRMKIDAYTAGYDYQPHANPLVDLNAKLWMTRARSATLSSVEPPRSELYITDRGWTRLDNRRIGGELNNASELKTGYGAFRLDLGGALQFENIGPQKGVLTTIHDVNANRTLRDASRREFSLNGKLEYRPIERLTLWSGGRYSRFRTEDNGITSTARREERTLRSISVRSPEHGHIGSMRWFPDQHGQYTDATDPRLHNGIVAENSNYPFEGIPFDEISAARVRVSPPRTMDTVVGYDHAGKQAHAAQGFSPSFGIAFEALPNALVYASHTQGLRMPSLFETSRGTLQVKPGRNLKPERSNTWEVGGSLMRNDLLKDRDASAIRLAYFDNKIVNYVSRYYDPTTNGTMTFSNADSYRTRGLELQSDYDAGGVFAHLSTTHYLKVHTCDSAFAAKLRASAHQDQPTENTPNCTSGSFMGSYANTHNPPKRSTNLTVGLRLLDQSLTLGGRMTYTSGPTARQDEPWHTGPTTWQINYHPIKVYDLFLTYRLLGATELRASVQNLTDQYYLDPLAQSLMPAPGRTLRLGMQTKF